MHYILRQVHRDNWLWEWTQTCLCVMMVPNVYGLIYAAFEEWHSCICTFPAVRQLFRCHRDAEEKPQGVLQPTCQTEQPVKTFFHCPFVHYSFFYDCFGTILKTGLGISKHYSQWAQPHTQYAPQILCKRKHSCTNYCIHTYKTIPCNCMKHKGLTLFEPV